MDSRSNLPNHSNGVLGNTCINHSLLVKLKYKRMMILFIRWWRREEITDAILFIIVVILFILAAIIGTIGL